MADGGNREPDEETPEESDWRFSLDDVGPDSGPEPLTPGRPRLENVVFFLIGVATALALVVSLLP